ncbi:DUF2730 family protein [Salmonella enterica subsp. enterica]
MGEILKAHLPGVAAVFSLIVTTILALLSKTYASKNEVDELKIKLTGLESKINSLPTVEQFHRVEMAVADVSGDAKEIKAAMKAIDNTTQLLLEKHLSEKD